MGVPSGSFAFSSFFFVTDRDLRRLDCHDISRLESHACALPLLHRVVARPGWDRILLCVDRTGVIPTEESDSIRKATAQKARRGVFAFGLQGQAREADPSTVFVEGIPAGAGVTSCGGVVGLRYSSGLQIRRQPWAPLPAGQGLHRRDPAQSRDGTTITAAGDSARQPARSSRAGRSRRWRSAQCVWNNRCAP
jgi:hypothetical protein